MISLLCILLGKVEILFLGVSASLVSFHFVLHHSMVCAPMFNGLIVSMT